MSWCINQVFLFPFLIHSCSVFFCLTMYLDFFFGFYLVCSCRSLHLTFSSFTFCGVKFLNVPTCFFPLCPLCGSPCLCSCIFYPCSRFSYRSCMKVSSVEVDVSFCRRIRWSNTHFLKIQRFYCHMCIISLVGLYRNAVAGVKVGRDQCFPDDVC